MQLRFECFGSLRDRPAPSRLTDDWRVLKHRLIGYRAFTPPGAADRVAASGTEGGMDVRMVRRTRRASHRERAPNGSRGPLWAFDDRVRGQRDTSSAGQHGSPVPLAKSSRARNSLILAPSAGRKSFTTASLPETVCHAHS
jgi:hypothetical protein